MPILKHLSFQGQEYTTTGAASGCDMTHLNANDKAKRASAESIAIADPSACDTVTCGACEDGYRNPADSATYCHRCPKAREYTENKILCKTCEDVSKIKYLPLNFTL